MTANVLILNGPNLNLLGVRQPGVYGNETLDGIEQACRDKAQALGVSLSFRQTNHEGELVDWIQEARDSFDAVILNAAAYTHTSVAVMDALLAIDKPVIEVHLSNIHQREPFRHHSYVSKAAYGMICGFGGFGYILALDAVARKLDLNAS